MSENRPSRPFSTLAAAALAVLFAAADAVLGQVRNVRQLSTRTNEVHQDAQISPNGLTIAFKGPGKLGIVGIGGANERTIVTSSSISTFVWSPDSTRIFYADGATVRAIPANGGTPTVLATFAMPAGQIINVWSVDSGAQFLYGTRYEPSTLRYYLFALDTSGAVLPVDLVQSFDVLSEARLDRSEAYLIYRAAGVVPFSPVRFFRCDIDGSNALDLLGGPAGITVQRAEFIDDGDTFVYTAQDPTSGTLQVFRANRFTRVPELLTGAPFTHQRATLSPDREWVLLEAVDGVGGNGPALLPVDGGGVVFLTDDAFVGNAGPTMANDNVTIAWSARLLSSTIPDQVYSVRLDNEMRVYPRAEIGTVLNLDIPVQPSQVGVTFLGNRAATPFLLSGVDYEFWLDASFAILGFGGPGPNVISTQLAIPSLPVLQGLRVWFQGLRFDPMQNTGEWTRYGEVVIF